ncbi:hypothetical protein LZC95_34745 [Pendulispora brunnea]|uniref:UvrD-like helicase C-terminal domain-containing protein n=1 Tax=Pendulispora brunnea TaxID=2905690 RepID=A0ABZ2JYQ2_9BACT
MTTPKLPFLFEHLDRVGGPYAAAGGTLFLRDDWHRRFILGLRAIADEDDGIAAAALFRPPFFAVDPFDLLRLHACRDSDSQNDDASTRAGEAIALVNELRRERHLRPPEVTARALLERTAFGRAAAIGPNGEQRLRHLRHLCNEFGRRAAEECLDFDAATETWRAWIEHPIQLDPPRPVASDTVQILTVHQAKVLQFPVVVLWDSRGEIKARERYPVWFADRARGDWLLRLEGLEWEESQGSRLLVREKAFTDEEKLRVLYVAATRARDLLVIPDAPGSDVNKHMGGLLLAEAAREGVSPHAMPEKRDEPAARTMEWDVETDWDALWLSHAKEAMRPQFVPAGASAVAKRATVPEKDGTFETKRRQGRFGPAFGDLVHRSIRLAVRRGLASEDAVHRALAATGTADFLEEGKADVARAIATLRSGGWLDGDFAFEVPVAAPGPQGMLVSGYIDFLARGETWALVDFKTDRSWKAILPKRILITFRRCEPMKLCSNRLAVPWIFGVVFSLRRMDGSCGFEPCGRDEPAG